MLYWFILLMTVELRRIKSCVFYLYNCELAPLSDAYATDSSLFTGLFWMLLINWLDFLRKTSSRKDYLFFIS